MPIPGATGSAGPMGAPSTVPGPSGAIGPKGDKGDAGADAVGTPGTNGQNAFTVTAAAFTQPAALANVTIEVASSLWVAGGQNLHVADAGEYQVVSLPDSTHITIQNLGYAGNATAGNVIASGKTVAPSGVQGASGASAILSASYVQLRDQVASGGAAQAIAFGAWTKKRLQTQDNPNGALVSLVADQFILLPGTYVVSGFIFTEQAYVRTRIQNITSAATLVQGLNMANMNNSGATCPINGRFAVIAAQTLEFQYWSQNNGGATVLGKPMTPPDAASPEIYATLDLLKVG